MRAATSRLGVLGVCAVAMAAVGCGDDAAGEGALDSGMPRDDAATESPDVTTGQADAATTGEPDASAPDVQVPSDCTPDAAEFEATVRPILEARCGVCHGEDPDFGAPYSLLGYDALNEPDAEGVPKTERVLQELTAGTMPPPGNIRPTEDEFETLTQWLSCGAGNYEYPSALEGSRDILQGPSTPPEDTTKVELTADEFAVPEKVDHYQSFFFEGVVEEDKFVRRFDVAIDETAVVHHITLQYADSGNYLYAWAPGTGVVQFPDGGLRVGPGDRFKVEVHYNNPRSLSEVKDSSGMLLYVAEPEGTEYAMLDPNTFSIQVPPHAAATATSHCTVESDFHIFAGLPHMHEIGSSFRHTIERADGSTEMLIELDGWAFDQQYFYEMGVDVEAGDEMTLTCEYRNPTDKQVVGGLGTGDEMCYDFMYVTPPDAQLDCPSAL